MQTKNFVILKWMEVGIEILPLELISSKAPSRESLIFYYHIARFALYTTFVLNYKQMLSNSTWEAINQFKPIQIIGITCEFGDWKQFTKRGLT